MTSTWCGGGKCGFRVSEIAYLLSQLASGCEDEGLAFVDGGINALENRDYKGGGFAGTRLRLGDDVLARNAGQNGALLNSRRFLKTVRVDASEKLILQFHLVEGVDIHGDLKGEVDTNL